MANPTIVVARNDGKSQQQSDATGQQCLGTQVTVSFAPQMANGAQAPNYIAANETLPATFEIGRNQSDIVAGGGAALYNSDVKITLPGERPKPGQE